MFVPAAHRLAVGSDDMNRYEKALSLLPAAMADAAGRRGQAGVEEIRLRLGRRPSVLRRGREEKLDCPVIGAGDLERILEKASGASYHMAAAMLADGYLNWEGLRIGVCGTVSLQNGSYHSFRSFRSLAVRIPRECQGICEGLMRSIYAECFESSLILSPPGGGKTTALRELSRCLSNRGYRLALVDERNELLAADSKGTGFDLGECSDVLSGMPKAEGAMMLLRAMNPQILAMDEITRPQDLEAIAQAAGCGVQLLATAHGSGLSDLQRRPLYRELLGLGVFQYVIEIRGSGEMRQYRAERIGA